MHLKKLEVSGHDRLDFLNRQFTADLSRLNPGDNCLTAWCNIQGRVTTLLWVQLNTNSITLLVPAETYHKLMPRLGMFVLRDDVTISPPIDCWLHSIEAIHTPITRPDPGETKPTSTLIDAGIPVLNSDTCDLFLPQSLNLDQLTGLSYSKGCYPGQEIVARTHFRGKLKQRMLRLACSAQAGETLHNSGGDKVGEVLLSDGEQCLAMIKLAALETTIQTEQGQAATLLPLPYSTDT